MQRASNRSYQWQKGRDNDYRARIWPDREKKATFVETDIEAVHQWSQFFRLLCLRRGFQSRLIAAESIAVARDERNISKKFSSYRVAKNRPQVATSYRIGSLSHQLSGVSVPLDVWNDRPFCRGTPRRISLPFGILASSGYASALSRARCDRGSSHIWKHSF